MSEDMDKRFNIPSNMVNRHEGVIELDPAMNIVQQIKYPE